MITHKIINGSARTIWLNDDDSEEYYDDEQDQDSYEGISDPNDYEAIQDGWVEDPKEH